MLSRLARTAVVSLFLAVSLGAVLAPIPVAAQSGNFGLNETVNAINDGAKGTVYDTSATPESIIGRIIKYILQFTGIIFFVLMVYAGIIWMTAQGDQKKVTDAKNTIIAAVIGIVIIAMAYGITSYVLTNVSGQGDTATGGTGQNP